MGLFGKSKSEDRDYESLTSMKSEPIYRSEIQTQIDPVLPDIDDMDYARTAMENFADELRESAAKQQSAIKRISTLNSATVSYTHLTLPTKA